jgi:pimeloyl-ACP methyl ester carboxylesterase
LTRLVANGIRQHVQRMPPAAVPPGHGGRAVVVFVHGLGTDSLASCYFTLAGPLADAGVDVVMYDLRGHGRSDRPETGYTVADHVADLAALLRALRVAAPVHLVGNSFGGTVAFSYALRHPDGVASVVLIEAEPATAAWSGKMADLLTRAAAELSRDEALAWISRQHGARTSRLAGAAGRALRDTTMAGDIPRGPLLSDADVRAVRHPVLAVYGSESDLVPTGVALRDQLAGCTLATIPGQRHSVLVQAPAEVLRLLLPWLAGGGRRAAPAGALGAAR